MMYSNKLAIAVKSNGKVLREVKDTVYLPFGSEYSLFIKNLNSVRALVKIEIDGTDVTDGTGLIVNANSNVDLERFIKNGNFEAGNRFKFIERSASVEQHRGVGVEDGLIRVEFQFEQPLPALNWYNNGWAKPTPHKPWPPHDPWNNDPWGSPQVFYNTCDSYSSPLRSMGGKGSLCRTITTSSANYASPTFGAGEPAAAAPSTFTAQVNDAGITVPGSVSNQKFVSGYISNLEAEKHVIVMKILGVAEGRVVVQPVTVKAKPKCVTCGRQNKAAAKFCTNCGTSLNIV